MRYIINSGIIRLWIHQQRHTQLDYYKRAMLYYGKMMIIVDNDNPHDLAEQVNTLLQDTVDGI